VRFREIAADLRDYAGFVPGLVISLAISLVASGYVSRAMAISRAHGWALVMFLGVVLSATITPSREALLFGAQGSGTCDFSRIGLASWQELSHLDDVSLNVLLFVPFGIAIGLCPRSRAKLVVLVGALVLPVAIELFQLVALPLGRQCQSSDVVDNLCGLLLGVIAGSVAGRLANAVGHRST
jgi:glycopeptide antibiotics resistance protein